MPGRPKKKGAVQGVVKTKTTRTVRESNISQEIDDAGLNKMLEKAVFRGSAYKSFSPSPKRADTFKSVMSTQRQGTNKWKQVKNKIVAISLKEYREQQRIAESSMNAPGAYEVPEQKMNHMTIFGPYKHKYESKPGPGDYEPEVKGVKPRSKAAVIVKESPPRKVDEPEGPAVGQYDGHIKPFGTDPRSMTLGGKYEWKADSNPAPGQYEAEGAVGQVKPRSQSAIIVKETGYKVPREPSPDAGMYDGHIKPFGANEKQMTLGGKYKWTADSNPAPGQYDPEGAVGQTKPRSKAAMIVEGSGYQVPREQSPDPGMYDGHIKAFGSNEKQMTLGGKYKWTADSNPAPGQYEPEGAVGQTKPRSKAAIIQEETGYKVPREASPDPGQYDGHIKAFGTSDKNMTLGGKYKWTADSNPAPGQYEPEGAIAQTKARSKAAIIQEESGYKVPRENSPDPGQYDGHIKAFGANDKAMTIGGKYKWTADSNPAPGQYEPEGAVSMTKARSKAAIIQEESGYKVPRENSPDPGQYDGHIKPFGANDKNMTIQGKYKWTADSNPAPGQYEPEGAVSQTKARSKAAIIQEESGYKVPREASPSPGQYDGHIKEFGTNDRAMTIGKKYKWTADSNPAPGQYEPEGAVSLTKARSKAAIIQEDSGYKVPRENAPDPGQYDGHIKPFGQNDRNMTIQGKHKFVADTNPAPGQYDPEGAVSMTKARSKAAIIQEESGYKVPREASPSPGQYDGHIREFGANDKNMTIGKKYKWTADSNPAPGQYEPEGAVSITKARSKAAIIVEESGYKVPRESSPSPGQYDGHIKAFGTNDRNMTIQGKYKWTADSNPAPGQYEPEGAVSQTKARSKAAIIQEEIGYKVPRESSPDPGQYDGHIKPFGANDKSMTIGKKYQWKADSNPAPGQYEPEGAVSITKARSQAAIIQEETGYKVPRESSPDPGQYDGHIKAFGQNERNMTIGKKYKWTADSNPAPGQYEPEGAVSMTKARSKAAIIQEETGYKVPREASPSPGQYDGHIKAFGSNDKNMTIQGKYKWVPDSNPAPGQYEPSQSLIKSKSKAAIIVEESGYKVPKESGPAPGEYDSHLTAFGASDKTMTIGKKYQWKADSNPAPGQYEPEGAVSMTKARSKAAIIQEDSGYKVPRESSPDPGQYDGHIRPFGVNDKAMTIGKKYQWKADSNPAPGQYEPDQSLIKSKSKAAIIVKESGYKVPKESNPSPGEYDGHITAFGSDSKGMTIQGKYQWKPDSNPAPGQYEPFDPSKPRSISAKVSVPMSPTKTPEYTPGPGETSFMTAFGNDSRGVYIGEKWKTKIEQTPGPGYYDNINSTNFTKSRATGGKINAEQMVYVDANSLAGPSRTIYQSRGEPRTMAMSKSVVFTSSSTKKAKVRPQTAVKKSTSNLMQATGHVKMNTLRDLAKQQYEEVDSKKVGVRARVKTAKKKTKRTTLD